MTVNVQTSHRLHETDEQRYSDEYGDLYLRAQEDPFDHPGLVKARHPGLKEGLRIVEIQLRLYRFLVDVVEDIISRNIQVGVERLNWKPAVELVLDNANFDPKDENIKKAMQCYQSIVPYVQPHHYDWKQFLAFSQYRLSLVKAKLRGLKESPREFVNYMDAIHQHDICQINLGESKGGTRNSRNDKQGKETDEAHARYFGRALVYLTGTCDRWLWACTIAENLAEITENRGLTQPELLMFDEEYQLWTARLISITSEIFTFTDGSFPKWVATTVRASKSIKPYFRARMAPQGQQGELEVHKWGLEKGPDLHLRVAVLCGAIETPHPSQVYTLPTLAEELIRMVKLDRLGRTIFKQFVLDSKPSFPFTPACT